jgi:hypothetical protein
LIGTFVWTARMKDDLLARSEGTVLRVIEGGALVAGEQARSRQTGENAEVASRHLVPFGAALFACDPVNAGCGYDGDFHGALCLCG